MTDAPPTSFAAPPVNNLRAAFWMLGCAVCFSVATVAIKVLGAHLPSMEIAFLRCFTGLTILVPLIVRYGWHVYRTAYPRLHLTRVVCSSLAISFSVYGVTHLHLATAISLSFSRPLFMILIAHFFLGEKIHWRRGLATIVGFIGVLIVVGPSDFSDIPGDAASLIAAAFIASAMAVVRRQAAVDNPATIMVWFSTGCAITTFLPAYFVWQWPQPSDYLPLMILATLGSSGQYMMIRAFAEGEATVVNPIDYSQIIFATLLGYFMFGEVPTKWTLIGGVVIVTSTLYILFRGAKIMKTQPAA